MPFDELPPAKLYLDEVQKIVSILTSSDASEFSVSFQVGDLRCDAIKDLQEVGGKTTDFRVEVTEIPGEHGIPSNRPPLHSWLKIDSMSSYLRLDCASEADLWTKHGKVADIFELNTIWWRRAAQILAARIGWWVIGTFALVGFIGSMTPLSQQTVHMDICGVSCRFWWLPLQSARQFICVYFATPWWCCVTLTRRVLKSGCGHMRLRLRFFSLPLCLVRLRKVLLITCGQRIRPLHPAPRVWVAVFTRTRTLSFATP
jgi:hypothetical protein